jgi:ATP-dependent Clp protease ATP-binding subunit ClpA
MDVSLTPAVKNALALSEKIARSLRHPLIGTDHLLMALVQHPYVGQVLQRCKANVDDVGNKAAAQAQRTHLPVEFSPTDNMMNSLSVTEVLITAAQHAATGNRREVNLADVLVAMTQIDTKHSVRSLLRNEGVDTHAMIQAIAAVPEKMMDAPTTPVLVDGQGTAVAATEPVQRQGLSRYAVSLNAKARAGKIDPVIGRTVEIERVIQTLARRRKNNPLLVGEAGVGKSSIAEGLAQRIVEGQVPASLRHLDIHALNMGALIAGTKYRGDFEARIQGLLDEARMDPNLVLFIDEIHTIVGAGSASGNAMDASNLFKPALASGELRVIGATTFAEYREVFGRDRALDRRFQKVDVKEPSVQEARQIIAGLQDTFQKHHGVIFSSEALDAAVDLAVRHLADRLLPDKAIDVLDEAGARHKLAYDGQPSPPPIGRADIETVIAQMARVPVGQVSVSDRSLLRTLDADLKTVIFGQDEAVASVFKAIKLARAGIRVGERPVANLLFAGPTGVGKTELTRQLAKHLGLPLVRFDMSEYMQEHAVASLIGAPPGFVGYGKGGLLTEAITKTPHAVLLLDEIEKAHPKMANLLLQIMDHGMLTDADGRSVDFRHVVVILTTNAGAAVGARASIGFRAQDHRTDMLQAIRGNFSPEFLNRLDAVIQFCPLGPIEIARVVDKSLGELGRLLQAQRVTIEVDAAARTWLAEHGYDPQYGARPMGRLIEKEIQEPLADAMLFGDLVDGGHAEFSLIDGAIVGRFVPAIRVVQPA